LLRFIQDDHKEFSPRAARFIQQANKGEAVLNVAAITIGEVFYAMKTFYHVERRKTAQVLSNLLDAPAFYLPEHRRIMDALERVQSANVDFGDAYLAATAAEAGIPVASFDRDMDKFKDVKRHAP